MRIFINMAGGFAGILVFYVSKGLAKMMNIRKQICKISPDTANRLKVLFPEMQFDSIKIVYSAWLPAHIFNRSIEGMTFNNSIYTAYDHVQHNYAGFMLLVHELVHIKQIRESGEFVFACRYGAQFINNGGYSIAMPFEKEAYKFVDHIPFDPWFYLITHMQQRPSFDNTNWKMTALAHFLDHGIYQGLQSSHIFNVKNYLERYGDLQATLGHHNYPAALLHWIQHGKEEGRMG